MNNQNCQKCKKSFEINGEDKNYYEMMKVPFPTFCPECRFQRRLTFRNDRTLYKRACEICKKEVISVYRPNGGVKIACQSCWWGDDFDTTAYGRDYDFSKSFFEQFKELLKDTPLIANFVVDESRMINSPYNNMVLDLKNCYMMFDSDFNEDCAYGSETENSLTCLDTTLIKKSEMCYECVNMTNCYRAFYSVDCENSNDIKFCRDCNGCTDCFGSVNLRNKSYYIFNEPYGNKAAYDEKLKEFDLSSRKHVEEIQHRIETLWNQGITKYMHEKQNSNSSGDYIYNSKNVTDSWLIYEGWNVRYSQYCVGPHVKDTYDFTQFGNNVERFYEVMQGGNGGSNVRFSWWPVNENTKVDYSMHVMTSHDLFGCVGLRGKSYCILNKQYTKEEYEDLREKIINQMQTMPYADQKGHEYFFGEFFPSELSPFAYNETTANEFFPLNKEEAIKNGFSWHDREERTYKPTITAELIPDNFSEIPNSITSEVLECVNSKKGFDDCTTAFRVIANEINFYNRFKLPLPDKCPNCRHRARLQKRTMPRFHNLKCANCQKEIFTAYKENTPNLYCKECYLGAVV